MKYNVVREKPTGDFVGGWCESKVIYIHYSHNLRVCFLYFVYKQFSKNIIYCNKKKKTHTTDRFQTRFANSSYKLRLSKLNNISPQNTNNNKLNCLSNFFHCLLTYDTTIIRIMMLSLL